jgi:hypothetical protein
MLMSWYDWNIIGRTINNQIMNQSSWQTKDSISPSSASITYFITCVWCLYLAADSICESLIYIWSGFNSRQATDRDDVIGVYTVSFTGSIPQILPSLKWSDLPVQLSILSNAVWSVTYLLLDCLKCYIPIVRLALTCGLFHYLIWKYGSIMASVTDQQGMLTPLINLIPPIVYL